jgi:hypothetical protein
VQHFDEELKRLVPTTQATASPFRAETPHFSPALSASVYRLEAGPCSEPHHVEIQCRIQCRILFISLHLAAAWAREAKTLSQVSTARCAFVHFGAIVSDGF